MNKKVLGIAVIFLAVVMLATPVNATSTVDQQQTVVNTDVAWSIGSDSQQELAQVVAAGLTGILTEVQFPVGGTPGSDLIVEIQGVSEGKPDGVVLTSATIDDLPYPLPYPPTFTSLVLNWVYFSAGDQYAIVLYSEGFCGVYPGPVGDPYPYGDAFFDARPNDPGEWLSVSIGTGIYDLPFKTLVITTPEAALQDLIDLVESFSLQRGVERSLVAMLSRALAAVEDTGANPRCGVIGILNGFIGEVNGLIDKKITSEQADQLTAAAQAIFSLTG